MGPLTTTIVAAILGGVVAWQLYRMRGGERPNWLQDRAAGLGRESVGAEAETAPSQEPVRAVVMPTAKVVVSSTPQSLEVIKGIGPVYARKLTAAGLVTYADLAAASVEQVRTIVAPDGQLVPHIESWIAQAAQLAARLG